MYLRGSTPNAARKVARRSGGAMGRSPSEKRFAGRGSSWSGSVLPKTRFDRKRGETTSAELLG
jgi:hypothetical protein